MNCPLENRDQLLLDYSARKLNAQDAAGMERHLDACVECREFVAGQRAVWSALDTWEAPPVSADFNRRLYQRIDTEVSWWAMLARPFRPLMLNRGVSVAAAACLVLVAAVLLDRPATPSRPAAADTAAVEVQPEQVEQALDAINLLSEFNRKVRPGAAGSKL